MGNASCRIEAGGRYRAGDAVVAEIGLDTIEDGIGYDVVADFTARYRPDELTGRLVIAVTNFPPRQIANFMSEVLVLGVPDDDGEVVLLRPDADVKPGTRVY